MSNRAVVTVATGQYVRGAVRLERRLQELGERHVFFDRWPEGGPAHSQVPYGFKARALELVGEHFDLILWADACIYPVLPLNRIWDRAGEHGAWIAHNGWRNVEWTADDAYPDLGITRAENEGIPHVVATAFALNLMHPAGREIFRKYVHLGLNTRAFCGPWKNGPAEEVPRGHSARVAPCGPPGVLGHRHDQTALSVLAWRAGVELTDCPDYFAYGKVGDSNIDPRTILLADGGY